MNTATNLKVFVQPLPKPLWRVNLRHLLSDSRWRSLRKALIDRQGLTCSRCGKDIVTSRQAHAHEVFALDTSVSPAVARLEKIELLCWHCHACQHFPHTVLLAAEQGLTRAVPDTIDHFCRVNGADQAAFEQHFQEAINAWRKASGMAWVVDFGPFATDVGRLRSDILPAQPPE